MQDSLVIQPMMQRWPNPTELRSMDSCIKILCRFQKNKQKLMTLKSSEVVFQALKFLQPQWPQRPQQPQWPQWPQQPHIIKKFTNPEGLIISSTQLTNASPFLWNGSSKIQFFTDIWSPFCWRLLRPADVIFLKTGWWNTIFFTSWSH